MQLNVELIDGKLRTTGGKLSATYLPRDLLRIYGASAVNPNHTLYGVWAKVQFLQDVALTLGQSPAIFTVVAGSYEDDNGKVVESPDYVSNPMTWPEAAAELDKRASHSFSRIECGSFQVGPMDLKGGIFGSQRRGEMAIVSAYTGQSKQQAGL